MIQISRESDKVLIQINLSIGYVITLDYKRYCTMDAELLRKQMQKDLTDKIQDIRKTAYELGWKEAKSKKVRKRTWFSGSINSDMV